MNNYIAVIASSKINLGATIPALKKFSTADIIIFCGSQKKFSNQRKNIFINDKIVYKLIPLTKEYLYDNKYLLKDEVLYCGKDSSLYIEAIESTKCAIMACREGTTSYCHDIEKIIGNNREYTIISIDNDPTHLQNAFQVSHHYDRIKYIQAVTDAIVSNVSRTDNNDTINITAGQHGIITFPPSVTPYMLYISPIQTPLLWDCNIPRFRFAKSEAEFQWFINSKLVSINSAHTFQTLWAVHKGLNNAESLTEIQKNPFDKYYSFEEMMSVAEPLHLIMYVQLIDNLTQMNGFSTIADDAFDYEACICSMRHFLKHTYDEKDIIGRGIKLDNVNDIQSKYQRHILKLKKATNYCKNKESIENAIKLLQQTNFIFDYDDFYNAVALAEIVIETAETVCRIVNME